MTPPFCLEGLRREFDSKIFLHKITGHSHIFELFCPQWYNITNAQLVNKVQNYDYSFYYGGATNLNHSGSKKIC